MGRAVLRRGPGTADSRVWQRAGLRAMQGRDAGKAGRADQRVGHGRAEGRADPG
jgi:hypothetical protein